ncbi:MAG: glycosyltransferase family 2 protein [Oscillospiraceae bacterium]|nr:glycosyltransferase family 2 protein [Oscillospiraceae bacterium]
MANKKKQKKKNARPPQALVRLSQVMIVKNEEKNIERALSWAKRVAIEQIVVDTGSTDRTVEIAKNMGAKVVHFDWVNDFSAAKNFAIEQASGNWIAFLDADEYFSDVDTKKLQIFLKRIMSDAQMKANFHVLNCALVNVDENGKTISTQDQERIFRNLPSIRYMGRVHERLAVDKANIVEVDEIKIIHTGYSDTSLKETGKAARNVEILRADLANKPNDLNVKAYLADSLKMSENPKDQTEADGLFQEVIDGGKDVIPDLLKKAYLHYIKKEIDDPGKRDECLELCKKACTAIPGDPDLNSIYETVRG